MYREGPNGYNIPYGHYKKTPSIISKTELNYISDLIKDVEFKHSSFIDSFKNMKEDDFVYLDPPYAPENDKSFVGYVADGFTLEMHNLLFDSIKKMKNIKFIMSNAKVELVMNQFQGYKCDDIVARRAINSKKPGSTTTEVIIYN
jgi:DNA adenine methylase